MSGTPRWAMSPLDFRVHLLVPDGGRPSSGVLAARCGLPLPVGVIPQDQLPPGPRCERCHVIVSADSAALDGSSPQEWLPMTLTGPECVDWMTLRLVHQGGVVKRRDAYLQHGRSLPQSLLADLLFDALVADGLLALAPPDNHGLASHIRPIFGGCYGDPWSACHRC